MYFLRLLLRIFFQAFHAQSVVGKAFKGIPHPRERLQLNGGKETAFNEFDPSHLKS